jgi:hypothetical protein
MRHIFCAGLLVAGLSCGDAADECGSLSVQECTKRDDCQPLFLSPWDEARQCWQAARQAACMSRDTLCIAALGCLRSPDGQLWLTGGCSVSGWQTKQTDMCGGSPRCD